MRWPEWPNPLQKAVYDIWVYQLAEDESPTGARLLEDRLGDCEPEALMRLLDEGQKQEEKAFALFALGHLGVPDVDSLLMSYVNSPEGMVRWASAIALGRRGVPTSFTTLQELLLEHIWDFQSFDQDKDQKERVDQAIDQWRAHRSAAGLNTTQDTSFEDFMDPATRKTWETDSQRSEIYSWYMHHRNTVAKLLGAWGNPEAVNALCHAFQVCCQIEQRPDAPFMTIKGLHSLQDHLAYALGQLGAWKAYAQIDLPEGRQLIGLTYMLFGALQIQERDIFISPLNIEIFKFIDPEPVLELLAQFGWSKIDPEPVLELLAQFGWSKAEQLEHIQLFHAAMEQRAYFHDFE